MNKLLCMLTLESSNSLASVALGVCSGCVTRRMHAMAMLLHVDGRHQQLHMSRQPHIGRIVIVLFS